MTCKSYLPSISVLFMYYIQGELINTWWIYTNLTCKTKRGHFKINNRQDLLETGRKKTLDFTLKGLYLDNSTKRKYLHL